jgi:hypothetical protein
MSEPDLSDEKKASIDGMTLYEMLDKWRNSPLGTFQTGDPYTEYFQKIMLEKRAADPAAWTQASKDLWRMTDHWKPVDIRDIKIRNSVMAISPDGGEIRVGTAMRYHYDYTQGFEFKWWDDSGRLLASAEEGWELYHIEHKYPTSAEVRSWFTPEFVVFWGCLLLLAAVVIGAVANIMSGWQ